MTMSPTLLETKLQVPLTRPGDRLVQRPHLLGVLDEATGQPLTLIAAPAGYGKTTLVSAFVQRRLSEGEPNRIGWLSLDADDNDPATFLSYVIAALQTGFP